MGGDGPSSLREALTEARDLGCTVSDVPHTGEVRVTHPRVVRSVRLNGRRKDCARVLVTFLKRVRTAREDLRHEPGSP
jgi:hypothetical protein